MEKLSQQNNERLLEYLMEFVSDNKKQLFEKIIEYRTRHITVVLEDIFQPHNASAVLRSCDCFGIQDVHIIENNYNYEVNPDVALGSSKWLSLYKYSNKDNNTLSTFENLRKKGYKIVATTPHKNDCLLEDLKLDQKTALVFGTELEGLSETAIKHADAFVKIPMYGFTESFNISVSAAIILQNLTERLRNSDILWELSNHEKTEVKLSWVRNVIKRVDLIEKKFLKNS
ncbi:MAG: RNA methyltransferase [Bacteroidales bacterium]